MRYDLCVRTDPRGPQEPLVNGVIDPVLFEMIVGTPGDGVTLEDHLVLWCARNEMCLEGPLGRTKQTLFAVAHVTVGSIYEFQELGFDVKTAGVLAGYAQTVRRDAWRFR